MSTIRVVFLSDTHLQHESVDVPDGDLLVHSGDFTVYGGLADVDTFGRWLRGLPHARKIVIAGNHDEVFWRQPQDARAALGDGTNGVTYLQDSGTTFAGLQIYGCPWQPRATPIAPGVRSGESREQWTHLIPDTCDLLITHGPPLGILDRWRAERLGCGKLLRRVRSVRPIVHSFGHIHEGSGVAVSGGTVFVNAAACGGKLRIENPCRVLDVDVRVRRADVAEESLMVA